MSVNLQAERLYGQVELVQGTGRRYRGQLCIMSFVAYLAGERHSDRPRTASPFIGSFAIQLNDGILPALRQDLKPFAPRIIATNDGHDFERTSVVLQMIMDDVLPRAACDFPGGRAHAQFELDNEALLGLAAGWGKSRSTESIASCFRAVRDAQERGECLSVAMTGGRLLVALVQRAPTLAAQRWYWAKALELLDRLCDVGADHREARIGSENATSGSVQRGSPVLAAEPKADLRKIERRPMRKISGLLRAVRDFVSA
jgi:hypothetical protein